jgi:hypothetical protein
MGGLGKKKKDVLVTRLRSGEAEKVPEGVELVLWEFSGVGHVGKRGSAVYVPPFSDDTRHSSAGVIIVIVLREAAAATAIALHHQL